MPLTTTTTMLQSAQKGGYAVGAFNAENMEMAQAILRAGEAMSAPVILQTTSGTLAYAPPEVFSGIGGALAKASKTPAALHLDHGSSFELAERAAHAGYTSLMIDGSTLPYDENIALTQRVVQMASGLPVEAELGTVGGKEDGHGAGGIAYTNPDEAADFVRRTGIQSLAVAIGTAHGVYKGEPRLDMDRLSAIRERVSVPLVLHGASGVPETSVRECIRRGICKVNYATELRIAFTSAVRAFLLENEGAIDPKQPMKAGREAVFRLVCDLIRLCGSEGRA